MANPLSVAKITQHPDKHEGATVRVQGWVRTRRDSKAGVSFVNLSDGTCQATLQLVVPNTLANYTEQVMKLTAGCSIEAEGTLVKGQGKTQALELQATSLKVHGFVDDPDTYPIQPKAHTYEYLREVAHLRPRTNTFGALVGVEDPSPLEGVPDFLLVIVSCREVRESIVSWLAGTGTFAMTADRLPALIASLTTSIALGISPASMGTF